eukprot:7161830-Pyramimonas_sp.AAC.1
MVLIGTPQGVRKVNCVKRLPPVLAKDPELAKAIKGRPWSHSDGVDTEEPGSAPAMAATEPVVPESELPPHLPPPPAAPWAPRRAYIRRD